MPHTDYQKIHAAQVSSVVYLHPMAGKTGSNATSALISMRIPRDLLARLRGAAEIKGVGYQTLVKQFLKEGLARLEAADAPAPTNGAAPKPKKMAPPAKPPAPLPHGLTDADLDDMLKDVEI